MKKLALTSLFFLFTLSSSWAVDEEHFGYLKSGDGLCSVAIYEQNDFLHKIDFKTRDYTVKAVNVELKKGKLTTHSETFEKVDDEYKQLLFGFPWPRLYKITLKNQGKGNYSISRTTLVFGKETITRNDVCITKYN